MDSTRIPNPCEEEGGGARHNAQVISWKLFIDNSYDPRHLDGQHKPRFLITVPIRNALHHQVKGIILSCLESMPTSGPNTKLPFILVVQISPVFSMFELCAKRWEEMVRANSYVFPFIWVQMRMYHEN
ncbi:hypothetical protein C5167_015475 [Papaver somniferum]|uniref:Uncharacterized protein n=1 Tax=Papaver somniferum TaxID=3469 RepID=A0A4Y7J818_PAPSO|nr:hypothetical protein C5167_015475 [Papaver somniferum]